MKKSLSATAMAKKTSQNATVITYDPSATARGIQAHKEYENAVARFLTPEARKARLSAEYAFYAGLAALSVLLLIASSL